MNRKVTKKLEMAAGVVEFQRNNPFSDKSQAAIAAQFAKKLEEATALAQTEHKEQLAARAAVRDAHALRRSLEAHLLPSVVSIGGFAVRGDAQAMSRFVTPRGNKGRAVFLTEAASLLEAARDHQDVLFRHGFTKVLLQELGARLQQLKTTTTEAKTAQQRHRETGAKLTRTLTELTDLLRLLDAFHRVRLERKPELLRVWSALRVAGSTATRSRRNVPAKQPPLQPSVAPAPNAPTAPLANSTPPTPPNQGTSPTSNPAVAAPASEGVDAPPPTQNPSAAA